MTDRLELLILGNGDFLEYGSPRISAPAAGRGRWCMFDPTFTQRQGAAGAVGAEGRGRRGGHEAAGAKDSHGVGKPRAHPGALGGAGAQCLLGGSSTVGQRRRRHSHDGCGGSNSGDAVVS